jgi:hypothetical protein
MVDAEVFVQLIVEEATIRGEVLSPIRLVRVLPILDVERFFDDSMRCALQMARVRG